jgi:hypothetical protein
METPVMYRTFSVTNITVLVGTQRHSHTHSTAFFQFSRCSRQSSPEVPGRMQIAGPLPMPNAGLRISAECLFSRSEEHSA